MNLAFRGGAEAIGLLLSVLTIVWLGRTIGPSDFGYYAVVGTLVALGTLVINAGLPTAGSQSVANDQANAGEALGVVTACRALFAAASVLAMLAVLGLLPTAPTFRIYFLEGLFVWAFLPASNGWALVAQGQIRALSAIRVASAVASLAAAVLLVRTPSDFALAGWVPAIDAGVSAAMTSIVAHRRSPFARPGNGQILGTARRYLRAGAHYLKSDLSIFVYTSSDRIFLYVFATPAIVGLYEAAYRVLQPFYTISIVVGDAMYLRIAQAFASGRLAPTFRRYVDLMLFGTIPVGFFFLFTAPAIISILYGPAYAAASGYLVILGWVITFGYTSGVAAAPFTAWNLPREYGNATALGAATNLGLNVALIPPFQGFGAAIATVIAKLAVTLAAMRYFRRATTYPLLRDFGEYLGISAASLATALAASLAAAQWTPYSTGVGVITFSLSYLGLIAIIRLRWYGPLSLATIRSVIRG